MKNKIITIILILILSTLVFSITINILITQKMKKYIYYSDIDNNINNIDCILTLGAMVYSDGRLSTMLKDRVDKSIELYKENLSDKIIMSGDHGTVEYDEVNAMMNYAIQNGVNKDDIFLDHAGFSTYESIYRAKYVFKVKKMIIVTQEYHLYRAVYIARKLGIEAYGVPCKQVIYKGQTKRDIREYISRVKDFFFVNFNAKPTYLGNEISLKESSSITHDK